MERRAHQRLRLHERVVLRSLDGRGAWLGSIADLSRGGAAITLDIWLEPATLLELRTAAFTMLAEVIHCEPAGPVFLVGVRFSHPIRPAEVASLVAHAPVPEPAEAAYRERAAVAPREADLAKKEEPE